MSTTVKSDPEELRKIIAEKKLSMTEISNILGVGSETIKKWLKDGIPSHQLGRLKKILQIKPVCCKVEKKEKFILEFNLVIDLMNPTQETIQKISSAIQTLTELKKSLFVANY